MLRSVGIPARIVEGFLGLERTEQPNEFVVRFSSAHAWVEADLGDGYWTTLDATPPGEIHPRVICGAWPQTSTIRWIQMDKECNLLDRSDQVMIFEHSRNWSPGKSLFLS